jgi:hypothetical protein
MTDEEHLERITNALATERLCSVLRDNGHVDDTEWLLAEIDRLADENQGLRLAAIQDEGLWSSQDAGLRAEVERLTAERDALRGGLIVAISYVSDSDAYGKLVNLVINSGYKMEATDGK